MRTLHDTASIDVSHPTVGPAAEAIDAVKTYGNGTSAVRALDGVSIRIAAGEFTAVMGPSGSGKSTLLQCLAGLDQLTSGTVRIGATDLATLSDRQMTMLRRRDVGFVFQSFNLIPTLTAQENIELPVKLGGGEVDRSWFDTVIDTVGLADRLTHRPSELSGGQQQRVAIARALTSRPKIIFADEPTGSLDSTSGTEILEFMRQAVTELGQTIVMVTHDPYAAAYADRVVFLADGQLVADLTHPDMDRIIDQMRSIGH